MSSLLAQSATADLGGWLHTLSPFALRISGGFGVRWYGLSYILGFVLGWWVLKQLAQRGLVLIPAERVGEAIVTVIMGVLIGGRLGYCLFYQPGLFVDFDGSFPFWGVLKIHEGGMASHGGMIGVTAAAWWVSRGFKVEGGEGGSGERVGRCPMLHVMDALALVAPIGVFFGRVANFINGELLGKIVAAPGQAAPWWAVRYPQEVVDAGHAPALSDEQGWALDRLVSETAPTAATFEEGYRRVMERVWAGDAETIARLEPLLSARHPSQLYQAVAEGLVVGAVVWGVFREPRRPGVVSAWFLMTYGVLRIATEFYRLPDAHLASARVLGLSRGQWLSALMIVLGAGLLLYAVRSGRERLGGWSGGGRRGGRREE